MNRGRGPRLRGRGPDSLAGVPSTAAMRVLAFRTWSIITVRLAELATSFQAL